MNLHKVVFQQNTIYYTLERKSVKNINLRIKPTGEIYVSANRKVAIKYINNFILANAPKIINILEKIQKRKQVTPHSYKYVNGEQFKILDKIYTLQVHLGFENKVYREYQEDNTNTLHLIVKSIDDLENPIAKKSIVENYFKQECNIIFRQLMQKIHQEFQKYKAIPMPKLTIRKMKTRWGSCNYMKYKVSLNSHLLQAPLPCIEYVIVHEFCHFIHPNHSPAFYNLVEKFLPDWHDRKILLAKKVEIIEK